MLTIKPRHDRRGFCLCGFDGLMKKMKKKRKKRLHAGKWSALLCLMKTLLITHRGTEVSEIEMEVFYGSDIDVKISEIVTESGKPLPWFWELWNMECTNNKKRLRMYGLAPVKENGTWVLKGVKVAS